MPRTLSHLTQAEQVEPRPTGEPTPLQPPSQPLSDDSHAHLIAPTIAFAESLGYTVSFEPIAGSAGGWCDTKAKQIVVDTNGPANVRLRTLVHEAIHALGVDYQHYSRAQAEVIVDSVIFWRGSANGGMAAGRRFGDACHPLGLLCHQSP